MVVMIPSVESVDATVEKEDRMVGGSSDEIEDSVEKAREVEMIEGGRDDNCGALDCKNLEMEQNCVADVAVVDNWGGCAEC